MNNLNFIRDYFLVLTKNNFLLAFLFSILLWQSFFYKSLAGYLTQVSFWSSECFQTKNIEKCKIALKIIDDLQLHSSSRENYSCQTRLLGLESHLIMTIINQPKSGKHQEEAIQEVRENCINLLESRK